MRARAALLLAMWGCGGGSGGKPTDAPRSLDADECAASLTCVPPLPGGWSGFDELYDGTAGGEPSCTSPFGTAATVGQAELMAQPASCDACTCGAPSGNHCPAMGGSAMLPLVSWGRVGFACAAPAPATKCTGGACMPVAATGFLPGLCVHHDGDIMCPEGFDDRHVFYGGVDDMRGCTTCTCSTASMGVCTPGGGSATGSATPSTAVTYCCLP